MLIPCLHLRSPLFLFLSAPLEELLMVLTLVVYKVPRLRFYWHRRATAMSPHSTRSYSNDLVSSTATEMPVAPRVQDLLLLFPEIFPSSLSLSVSVRSCFSKKLWILDPSSVAVQLVVDSRDPVLRCSGSLGGWLHESTMVATTHGICGGRHLIIIMHEVIFK